METEESRDLEAEAAELEERERTLRAEREALAAAEAELAAEQERLNREETEHNREFCHESHVCHAVTEGGNSSFASFAPIVPCRIRSAHTYKQQQNHYKFLLTW